ncbi:hypothetical protein BaOVIS_005950 [Babesia ovis]|uniref:Uncharacterized protein n=1 Tax=Babesia ovis TaxID=5869 RepID=A0A9W5T8Y1_BABOV|nr:hypothetical protein BaOVIS_005950 [Babesia ovis]
MDDKSEPVDAEEVVESSDAEIQQSLGTEDIYNNAVHATRDALSDVVGFSSRRVDDVNPIPTLPSDPLREALPQRQSNPNGMLMGPDDPFFREIQTNPRLNGLGPVRYDVIGPFGQEPDPDIDVPPGIPQFPRRGGGFPNPGPGRFGGPGGGLGGFFP